METNNSQFFSFEGQTELRVVLMGKTGSGKSSLGNTLLGVDEFQVARGMSSMTDKCQHSEAQRFGVNLQVTDTPGVCDTHRSEMEVLKEVGKSLSVAAPGPHVILMVLRCDRRFTQEEYDAYRTLKSLFGDEICNHMIIVFAGIDCFGNTEKDRETGLRREVERCPALLKRVISDASGRYCGVDNGASRRLRNQQAEMMLTRIQSLVSDNKGHYFSNQIVNEVDFHLQSFIMQRMQETGQTYADALRTSRRDILQENVNPNFFRTLLDIVKKKIFPALKAIFGDAVVLGKQAISTYCSVM